MAKSFLTDIDLNGNQLLKAILEVVATNPVANLAKGRIAFNSASNVPIVYDGTTWKNLQYELSGTQTAHNHAVTLSGDATGTGNTGTSIALTLANSGVTAGTYNNVATQVRPFTVDAKGRVTAIGTAVTIAPAWGSVTGKPTTIAGYGLTTELQGLLDLKLDKSIFDELFEKDTTTVPGTTLIKAKYAFYSVGEVSAWGVGSGSGGGGASYSRLDDWASYDSSKATWVLSALLGNDLKTRVTNLEGGSAMSYVVTGSGNAITDVTKTGTIVTATKGLTFATLDGGGKVPSSQLPSYVDDVLEFTNLAGFPATGETGKIYVALDTNLTYRWSGTAFVEISPSLALGTNSSTAFRGDYGQLAYTHATNKGIALTSGLYKITTNSEGHVSAGVAVTKADITALGIPGQDTVYTLPTATSTVKGGIELFSDTVQSVAANAVTATASRTYGVQLNSSGQAVVNVPWTDTVFTLLQASAALGGVKKLTGTISASTSTTVVHGFGHRYAIAQVKAISDGSVVECDVKVDATNVVFTFNVAPVANTYEYTIIG